MQESIELAHALAWPVVALVVVLVLSLRSGRELLSQLVGRISRIKGGGFEIDLTAEKAVQVKQDLEETIRGFREGVKKEFDRQANVERVRECLERVYEEVIKDALLVPDHGFKATVYVPDALFQGLLYRLVDYYPRGGGRGKVYSIRYGIIGKTWRLKKSENVVVTPDTEKLIIEWGMTQAETVQSSRSAKTFVCIILKDAARTPLGLLFLESETEDAFVEDVVERLESSESLKSLSAAVEKVVYTLGSVAQPPIAIFDE